MALTTTVLFDLPQRELASLIINRISRASTFSIVSGFATLGGLAALADAIKARPAHLKTLIVGAATYPGFQVMDELLAAGVPSDRLHVHLGHTKASKGSFARFHPMLHSKIYYMELPREQACAFIGSHNMTAFALTGMNGEAAVMIEGPMNSPEFEKVRQHISAAQSQSTCYSSAMKEGYSWWTEQSINGLKAQVKVPHDWTNARTILLFARAERWRHPQVGDDLYFEIPAGIAKVATLTTEVHLFLFNTLPANPLQALNTSSTADAHYTCLVLGAENERGNREVDANWLIVESPTPVLTRVANGVYRPTTQFGKQQVRATIKGDRVPEYEYLFDRENQGWYPELTSEGELKLADRRFNADVNDEAGNNWQLVKRLVPRSGKAREADELALKMVAPESGSFILVALRRKRKPVVRIRDNTLRLDMVDDE